MHSEQINELAGALAKAQGKFKAAAKGRENTFYKSAYADLPCVMEACRSALSENGIAVIQVTQFEGQENWLETLLVHSSGQWIKSRYPVRPVKNDPQGLGSAQTYARRYALMAMVGVVADDDDDGNAGSGKTNGRITESLPPQGPIGTDQDKKAIANQWGQAALARIEATKTYNDLGEWHRLNADRIAAVRGHNEALHKRVLAALDKKQNDLRPIAAE